MTREAISILYRAERQDIDPLPSLKLEGKGVSDLVSKMTDAIRAVHGQEVALTKQKAAASLLPEDFDNIDTVTLDGSQMGEEADF